MSHTSFLRLLNSCADIRTRRICQMERKANIRASTLYLLVPVRSSSRRRARWIERLIAVCLLLAISRWSPSFQDLSMVSSSARCNNLEAREVVPDSDVTAANDNFPNRKDRLICSRDPPLPAHRLLTQSLFLVAVWMTLIGQTKKIKRAPLFLWLFLP